LQDIDKADNRVCPVILQMAPADLCAYIDNDHLNTQSEEEVAAAILRWLRHRPETRLTAMDHVMQVCCIGALLLFREQALLRI